MRISKAFQAARALALAVLLSFSGAVAHAQSLPTEPGSPSYTMNFAIDGRGNGTATLWRQKLADGKEYLLARVTPRPSSRGNELNFCSSDITYTYDGVADQMLAFIAVPTIGGNSISCNALAGPRTYVIDRGQGAGTPSSRWTLDKAFSVKFGKNDSVIVAEAGAPAGSIATAFNFSDLWWVPAESGWGLQIIHHVGTGGDLVGTLYAYGNDGSPRWYLIAGGQWQGSTYSASMYEASGPAGGFAGFDKFDPRAVKQAAVGRISILFSSDRTAVMNYTAGSASGSKKIERLVF